MKEHLGDNRVLDLKGWKKEIVTLNLEKSIEEAADYTGIGRNTLRNLVEWEKLPVPKVGRKVLIKSDMLEKFMEVNEGKNLRDKNSERAAYAAHSQTVMLTTLLSLFHCHLQEGATKHNTKTFIYPHEQAA